MSVKTKRVDFGEQELIDLAKQIRKKILIRKAQKAYSNLSEAARDVVTVSDQVTPGPDILSCNLTLDGNFTAVTLNDKVTTFAKFNPNDMKLVQLKKPFRTKRGTLGPKVPRSKFSIEAGVSKALHRAVNKLLEPFST